MISHLFEILEEIKKLKEMEGILDDYIEDIRNEQINIHNFMQQRAFSSW